MSPTSMAENASRYKPWLRNVHVRRAFILFAVPILLPIKILLFIPRAVIDGIWPELVNAWKDERQQES